MPLLSHNLEPVGRVVAAEVDGAADGGQELRDGAARGGVAGGQQGRPGDGAVGLPELGAVGGVGGREVEQAAGGGQVGGIAAGQP